MSREDTRRVVQGLLAGLRIVGLIALYWIIGMVGVGLLWLAYQ